jgi:hypothetical protein
MMQTEKKIISGIGNSLADTRFKNKKIRPPKKSDVGVWAKNMFGRK